MVEGAAADDRLAEHVVVDGVRRLAGPWAASMSSVVSGANVGLNTMRPGDVDERDLHRVPEVVRKSDESDPGCRGQLE